MLSLKTLLPPRLGTVVAVAMLFAGLPLVAIGQTGPGGVGNSGGTTSGDGAAQPENAMWLRGDVGVFRNTSCTTLAANTDDVVCWEDQSGNGNNATHDNNLQGNPPTFQDVLTDINSQPALNFIAQGQRSNLEIPTTLLDAAGGSNTDDHTIIVVSRTTSSSNTDQGIVAFTSGNNDNQRSDRYTGLRYNLNPSGQTIEPVVAQAGNGDANGAAANATITNFQLLTSRFESGTGNVALEVNGTQEATGTGDASLSPAFGRIGTYNENNFDRGLDGDVAEVIVFRNAINETQRRIVENYLAEKYGLAIDNDYYAQGSTHPGDIVGIGQSSTNGNHLSATSAQLNVNTGGNADLGDGVYVLFGHDTNSYSFSTNERPNGDSNAQKTVREWRVQITGAPSATVDLNLSNLPGLPGSTNDYGVFVDDDGDFTSGATFYPLNASGEATNVVIPQGASIALGAVNRIVSFTNNSATVFENEGGDNLGDPFAPTILASLNYASSTSLTIDFGTTNVSPGIVQGDDYRTTGSPPTFTFPANTEGPVDVNVGNFEVLNDGETQENTEFVDITLQAGSSFGVSSTMGTLEFGIKDDDNPRKFSFVSSTPSPSTATEGSTTTLTYEVTLPNGETGSASTEATYEVSGSVTEGEDYEIDSNPGGTTGVVAIGGGQNNATFTITVLDDALYEPTETITVTLVSATSGTIDPDGISSVDRDIADDDPVPTVQFSPRAEAGPESTNGTLTVELSAAVGADVDVNFALDSGATTADPSDYSLGTSPVTIPAGQLTTSIDIFVTDDSEEESPEDIILNLTGATQGVTLGTDGVGTYTITDNDGLGSVGPGGVGSPASLKVWLRAEDLSLNSGDPVNTWTDQSGNGNDATDGGSNPPSFTTGAVNGQPAVTFDGNNDQLDIGVSDIINLPGGDNTVYSVVANASTNIGQDQLVYGIADGGNNRNQVVQSLYYESQGRADFGARGGVNNNDFADVNLASQGVGDFNVVGSILEGTTITVRANAAIGTNADVQPSTGDRAFLGEAVNNNEFGGDLPEFFAYSTALNDVQTVIVENYLAAKYNIPLSADDLYVGDNSGNGEFDAEVIGIGRDTDTNAHFQAQGGGLVLAIDAGFEGTTSTDYLLAGHQGGETGVNTTDVSTTGSETISARSERDWYVTVVDDDDPHAADVTVVLEDIGISVNQPASDGYRLLFRTGQTGDWGVIASARSANADGEVVFPAVNFPNSGTFAIGTVDGVGSPLPSALALTIVGTDGSGSAGSPGADAGYRLLGVPGQNADGTSIASGALFTASDPQFIEYNLPSGAMAYTYSGGYSALTAPTDPLPNGRGALIFFFDDSGTADADPIDPSLTLDVNADYGTPEAVTSGNVVVGDGTPNGEDPALAAPDEFHLLANPYNGTFNLSGLNIGTGGTNGDGDSNADFSDVIEIWDPDPDGDPATDDAGFITRTKSASDVVSRWQGFFVQRSDLTDNGSGLAETLTFSDTGIESETNEPLVGSQATTAPNYARLHLKIAALDGAGQTQASSTPAPVFFHDRATDGYDALDAEALTSFVGTYVALAFDGTRNDEPVLKAQESRSLQPSESFEVDLHIASGGIAPAAYAIELGTLEHIPPTWELSLIDTKGTASTDDDTMMPLRPDAPVTVDAQTTSTVNAVAAVSQAGTGSVPSVRPLRHPERMVTTAEASKSESTVPPLRLRIDPTSTLPVELARFDATTSDQNVTLTWETASETNNAGFRVERQVERDADADAEDADAQFETVRFVEGRGTTTEAQRYSATVRDLEYGTHTFRLVQVDLDGTETVTETVQTEVTLQRPYAVGAPYPNPAIQRATLNVAVREAQTVRVELFDLLGRRVRVAFDREIAASDTRSIPIQTSNLSSGVYFLRIIGEQFTETRRVTVVR